MKRDAKQALKSAKKIINLVNLDGAVSCFGCYLILGTLSCSIRFNSIGENYGKTISKQIMAIPGKLG